MDDIREVLRECEEQKEAILRCCEDIIILFDQEMKVIWASRNVAKIQANPVGMCCHELFCGKEATCAGCRVHMGVQGISGSHFGDEMVVVGAGSKGLFFRLRSTPLRDGRGGKHRVLVVAKDITGKLRLEKQLHHASKMEAIGTLAGGIAHDFNNILTPIMGYSEIMRLNIQDDKLDRDTSLLYLDQILVAAKRARKLIEQVLVFSRHTETKESRQAIHPIIKEGIKLMQATIPPSIELVQDVDTDCGQVSVDPVEVHQILVNLCMNAIDAMAGKNGCLRIALKKSDRPEPGCEWLVLSVSDSGCGIPSQNIDRIFDPYFTTKEKARGTGMGLAMVHGIITRQGGRIEVESNIDKGTTVKLYLPVIQEEVELKNSVESVIFPGADEHILLVDDEEQVLAATAEMLRKLNYRVTEMASARHALLEFIKRPAQFDLVITDLTMPYMSGIDLCEKIKDVRDDIPFLLFSGYLEDFSRSRAVQAGINGFCMKPVALPQLSKNIRQLLGPIR
ncbi:MAG: ATP-binding protein [Desulfopila sp.]|jgi:signal transduction histidine kinase|nr:ATP-binding protein [Desulfopila sp.]